MVETTVVHLEYRDPKSHSALLKPYTSDILSAETARGRRVLVERFDKKLNLTHIHSGNRHSMSFPFFGGESGASVRRTTYSVI